MMRFVEGFRQEVLVYFKLKVEHTTLIRWFYDMSIMNAAVSYEGCTYRQIDCQKAIADLPILGKSAAKIHKLLLELQQKGLMASVQVEGEAAFYYRMTDYAKYLTGDGQ